MTSHSPSDPIRVLLVDDQSLFREGMRTLLSIQDNVEVVGEAGDGFEALRLTRQLVPDVILMDLKMPRLDGVETTRRLIEDHPDSRIIILTTFDDDELVFEGLRAGAMGYLLKDVSSEKLIEAIQVASRGDSFLQPSIAAKVVAEFSRLSLMQPSPGKELPEPLSDRELEVLKLVAAGASNREIADRLVIAEGTVKNHVTNILGKLGVRDRTQAALIARDLGLL
jgi:DNA-binding NarL/FixJ family response regulator